MAYGSGDGTVLDGADSNTRSRARNALSIFSPIGIPAIRNRTHGRRPANVFPELDCVRDRLPSRVIAAIEHRAAEIGISAERVLIAAGFMDEDHYVYALARMLGFEYETFDDRGRGCCPLNDQRLLLAAKIGLLPLVIDDEEVFVLAPHSVREFVHYLTFHPRVRFRLTSSARLNLFIADKGRAAVAYEATSALRSRWPRLCAGSSSQLFRVGSAALLVSLLAALVAFPSATLVTVEASLAVAFLGALGLRLLGSYLTALPSPTERILDHDLPVYTIIVALYRESKAVKGLVASLRDLEYPGIMAQTPQAP